MVASFNKPTHFLILQSRNEMTVHCGDCFDLH